MKFFEKLFFWTKENSNVPIEEIEKAVIPNDVLELLPDMQGKKKERVIHDTQINENGLLVVLSSEYPIE
jgi:hypothetical protein